MAPSNATSGSRADDLNGRVLGGRYRIERPIAAGGMARVWEATDQTLARRVAVKVLHHHLAHDEAFVHRFRAEAIAAARLAHPSIVSVYDTLEEDDVNAIVMELVRGTTMRADLDQHGPLALSAVLAIGSQVADALGAAHASGLVHRDVKPANILLSSDGRVLVADFGIAKAAQGADLTSDGSMVGTAKYLAPEQVEGHAVDGRTDLYALGIVLYEALTGTAPFTADTDAAVALARLHRDPTPPRQLRPEIPTAVQDVVLQAMARDPDHRFANAAVMRRALLQAGADPTKAPAAAQAAVAAKASSGPGPGTASVPSRLTPPVRAVPPAVSQPRPRPPEPEQAPLEPPRSHRPVAWVVGVLLLLAAVAAAVVIIGPFDSSSGSGAGQPVAISRFATFDPDGPGDGENDGDLGLLQDDDPITTWRTERYGSPDLGVDKRGAGLIAVVASPSDLAHLDLGTPQGGWTAEVYVVDVEPPVDLASWGEPVARISDASPSDGTVGVDLQGRRGSAVLVWFTGLVPDGDKYDVRIGSVELRTP